MPRGNYGPKSKKLKDFCEGEGREWLPASEETARLYLATLLHSGGIRATSLQPYLSAINNYHEDMGWSGPAKGISVTRAVTGITVRMMTAETTGVTVTERTWLLLAKHVRTENVMMDEDGVTVHCGPDPKEGQEPQAEETTAVYPLVGGGRATAYINPTGPGNARLLWVAGTTGNLFGYQRAQLTRPSSSSLPSLLRQLSLSVQGGAVHFYHRSAADDQAPADSDSMASAAELHEALLLVGIARHAKYVSVWERLTSGPRQQARSTQPCRDDLATACSDESHRNEHPEARSLGDHEEEERTAGTSGGGRLRPARCPLALRRFNVDVTDVWVQHIPHARLVAAMHSLHMDSV
ncbi:hypothetical protein CYMTET_9545 [Cymbomonas tetramitiformis]|uniref:Uncharacterized protein n=1 Tax=Cymbomonas tetramitiformis TaxID=36881 RepID=A0AAE0GR31_9CHLO|nr:hypothetical protein CYMTET_9545 [Cymbomonas tetramitiformis]